MMGTFGIEPPQNGLYDGINVHNRRPRDAGDLIAAGPPSGQIAVNSPTRPQQGPANGQNTHLYRWTYLYLCAEYFQAGWEYIAARIMGHRAFEPPKCGLGSRGWRGENVEQWHRGQSCGPPSREQCTARARS